MRQLSLFEHQQGYVPSTEKIYQRVSEPESCDFDVITVFNDNKIVGMFTYQWETSTQVWFGGLQIDKTAQSGGAASQAMQQFFQFLLEKPRFSAVRLNVDRENVTTMRFYQRLGFELDALIEHNNKLSWLMTLHRATLDNITSFKQSS